MSHEPALSTYQREFWDEDTSLSMLDDIDSELNKKSTSRKSLWLVGLLVIVGLVGAALINNRGSPVAERNEMIATHNEMQHEEMASVPIISADYVPPNCVAGEYLSSGKCNICPVGYACDGKSKNICQPGSYQKNVGQSKCKLADCGYFVPAPGSTTQEICRAGTWSAAGASRCTPAQKGYFAKVGACSETKCPVGKYQDCEGQSECPKGPCGHYIPGDGSPGFLKCKIGTYQPKEAQATCINTVPGTWAGEGFCNPMACTPGEYQDKPKQGSCKKADCGHYVAGAGAKAQTPCEIGKWQPLPGEPTCLDLPAGYISDQGGCATKCCPPGQYRDGKTFKCVKAPCGSFVKDKCATAPTPCDPGQYSIEGSTQCTKAPKGSIPDATQCKTVKCPPGKYQNLDGQATCRTTKCGFIAPNPGTINPVPCPAGQYQTMGGKTSCLDCPAGTYQGQTGQCGCNKCLLGTFNPIVKQIKCKDSPCGQFVNYKGAKATQPCPPGKFQAKTAQSSCDDAPPGQYAPGATCDAKKCDPGTFADKPGMSKCTEAPCGSIVADTGLPAATPCPAGTYQPLPGQTACLDAPTGGFTSKGGMCQEELCKPGFYQPQTGQQLCLPAACGHYVPMAGSADQFACGEGRYQPNTKQTKCLKAGLGKYVPTTGSCNQKDCPEGTFTDCQGQSKCIPAHCGSYVTGVGQSSSKFCPPGQYQDATGAGTCKDARPGTYSAGGMCRDQECDPGTYQNQGGQSSCKAASCGHYVDMEGQRDQRKCGSASYQPDKGRTGCLRTTHFLAPNPGTCERGVTGTFYRGPSKMSWPNAKKYCESNGDQLAIVKNAAENAAVLSACPSTICWLGGSDINKEGKWTWVDGTLLSNTYSNWAPGEPNHANGGEDCLQTWTTAGQWNDNKCPDLYYFVCERRQKICDVAGFEGVKGLDCPKLKGPTGVLESFQPTNGGSSKKMTLCMSKVCRSTAPATNGHVTFGNGLFLDSAAHCGASGIPVSVDTSTAGCTMLGGSYKEPNCNNLALCSNGRYYFAPKSAACSWWGIFYMPEARCLAMGGWIHGNSVPGTAMVYCHFVVCKR